MRGRRVPEMERSTLWRWLGMCGVGCLQTGPLLYALDRGTMESGQLVRAAEGSLWLRWWSTSLLAWGAVALVLALVCWVHARQGQRQGP